MIIATIEFPNGSRINLDEKGRWTGDDEMLVTYANDYKETNSDANVPALFLAVHTALATDVAVVYDTVSGNLFLDVNHDGLLTTADFEVHLTGVTHLASVNLDVLGA